MARGVTGDAQVSGIVPTVCGAGVPCSAGSPPVPTTSAAAQAPGPTPSAPAPTAAGVSGRGTPGAALPSDASAQKGAASPGPSTPAPPPPQYTSLSISFGKKGDYVQPGNVYCVGAGGKMAYDWLYSTTTDAGEYFPTRVGSISGVVSLRLNGWGAPPTSATDGDINSLKQRLAWKVTVEQNTIIPSLALQGRGTDGTLALVEALAELQREVLGSIVTIPRGMYNVQITTQGSSLGGAVTASAGPGPAQAPPVTASLSAGIAAAAMRATGAWAGSRRRLASAGGVPFYVADAQSRDAYLADVGTVEPSVDDQTFTVTHTIYAASLPDATQMQTAINSNRAQLDVGWKSMLQNTPAQTPTPAPATSATPGAGGPTPAVASPTPQPTPSIQQLLSTVAGSIVVKTNRVQQPVRVALPNESLDELAYGPGQESGAAATGGARPWLVASWSAAVAVGLLLG